MNYIIRSLDANGNGHIEVTRDDGSTFGQNVAGLSVQSEAELDDYIRTLIVDVGNRSLKAPVPAIVLSKIGVRRTVPQI